MKIKSELPPIPPGIGFSVFHSTKKKIENLENIVADLHFKVTMINYYLRDREEKNAKQERCVVSEHEGELE